MPLIARLFIKSGLLYFLAALTLGLLLALGNHLTLPPFLKAIGPTHLHLFMVGWVTQIIFGVALWFFPRYSKEQPRGPEWLNYAAFITLNTGLLLRLITEPLHAIRPTPAIAHLLAASALLQWLAAIAFAIAIWPRVRTKPDRRKTDRRK